MFGSFDISASALNAQRVRFETIQSNIANIDTITGPGGGNTPYRRLMTIFQAQRTADGGGAGVRVASIVEDPSDFNQRNEPGNPLAVNGWVKYPNVDLATESVDALESSRAYEANVTAIETTKSMMNATMRLIA